eukprot:TRINITY_DN11781_c0_g1_i1.p1 TRINITY_DN11781_c0_g1~~TRINITY_DN11781_c0_g1_i1.p1  ORF type:complete len:379 (-),score=109.29 TRINITY_DN11781_c0_g1_i1:96-1232(-)
MTEQKQSQEESKVMADKSVTFAEYPSIENHYRDEIMKQVEEKGYTDPKITWCGSEKVHGSNFAISYDGSKIECYKRSGIIGPKESFFNYQALRDRYTDKIKQAYQSVKKKHTDASVIAIFGEYFGGEYPHKDVSQKDKKKPVQRGIWYTSNCYEFYPFDISLDFKQYLPYNESLSVFEECGFPFYAKPVVKGTWKEVNAIDVETLYSWIPDAQKLPRIEKNYVEGLVLRPYDQVLFIGENERVIIKKKRKDFSEISQGPSKDTKAKEEKKESKTKDKTISPAVAAVNTDIVRYVTEARLRGTMSKIGEITSPKEINKVKAKLMLDIMGDYKKDWKTTQATLKVADLTNGDWKMVQEHVKQETNKFVDGKADAIIKGTF